MAGMLFVALFYSLRAGQYSQIAAEWQSLLIYLFVFIGLMLFSAMSFWVELKQTSWRRPVHAVLLFWLVAMSIFFVSTTS
ncbi:MAG: hypothetical protein HKM24_01775 [Gammaproteobacteria bacterium]|nr:hypothetical protein [Gammaproteobacteria bacterium]